MIMTMVVVAMSPVMMLMMLMVAKTVIKSGMNNDEKNRFNCNVLKNSRKPLLVMTYSAAAESALLQAQSEVRRGRPPTPGGAGASNS